VFPFLNQKKLSNSQVIKHILNQAKRSQIAKEGAPGGVRLKKEAMRCGDWVLRLAVWRAGGTGRTGTAAACNASLASALVTVCLGKQTGRSKHTALACRFDPRPMGSMIWSWKMGISIAGVGEDDQERRQ